MLHLRFEEKDNARPDLQGEEQGDSNGEFGVPGFVADGVHTQQCAQATAQRGGGHQDCFRDSPLLFSGAALVRKHK